MKTELLNDSFNLKDFDERLEEFIKDYDNGFDDVGMKIAILPPIEPKKYVNPVRPYRTITTTGWNEYDAVIDFFEELELICINENIGPIDGFERVYVIPEEAFPDLYPENDPDYEQKLEAMRAMFRK